MCPQPKPWKHRISTPTGPDAARLAADQAWLAKCVADRRRALGETGTLHTHNASIHGFSGAGV